MDTVLVIAQGGTWHIPSGRSGHGVGFRHLLFPTLPRPIVYTGQVSDDEGRPRAIGGVKSSIVTTLPGVIALRRGHADREQEKD